MSYHEDEHCADQLWATWLEWPRKCQPLMCAQCASVTEVKYLWDYVQESQELGSMMGDGCKSA